MQLIYHYNLFSKVWDIYVSNQFVLVQGKKTQYKYMINIVFQWIYSWMKIDYMTES